MKNPTQAEVETEIEALKGQLDRVRRLSVFGEDNRRKIQAQIEVLENDYDDDDIEDFIDDDYQDDANDARRWLDGDSSDGTLSASWEPLCQ